MSPAPCSPAESALPRAELDLGVTSREDAVEKDLFSHLRTDSWQLVRRIWWQSGTDDAMIDELKSIEPIGFLSFAPASAGTNRADVYRRIIQNRPYGRGGSASAACRPVWFRLRRL